MPSLPCPDVLRVPGGGLKRQWPFPVLLVINYPNNVVYLGHGDSKKRLSKLKKGSKNELTLIQILIQFKNLNLTRTHPGHTLSIFHDGLAG